MGNTFAIPVEVKRSIMKYNKAILIPFGISLTLGTIVFLVEVFGVTFGVIPKIDYSKVTLITLYYWLLSSIILTMMLIVSNSRRK